MHSVHGEKFTEVTAFSLHLVSPDFEAESWYNSCHIRRFRWKMLPPILVDRFWSKPCQ
jgi:hypothetical protein